MLFRSYYSCYKHRQFRENILGCKAIEEKNIIHLLSIIRPGVVFRYGFLPTVLSRGVQFSIFSETIRKRIKMTVFFNIWLPDGIGTVWPSVWLVSRSCLPLMNTVCLLFCLTATPTMTIAFSPQKVLFHSSTIMAGNVVLSIPPGKSAISAVKISASLLYAQDTKKI